MAGGGAARVAQLTFPFGYTRPRQQLRELAQVCLDEGPASATQAGVSLGGQSPPTLPWGAALLRGCRRASLIVQVLAGRGVGGDSEFVGEVRLVDVSELCSYSSYF